MVNIYWFLGGYILLLLIVTYFITRKQTEEDFLISGRNRGGWQILASKFAASIGAAYFITYTGFAYEYGTGVLTLLLGIVFGFLIFAYWAAPKIHRPSKVNKFYTIGDYVYYQTKSKKARLTANILSSAILFSWLLVTIIGGAKIINDFGFLSYGAGVLITGLVVLAYILLAGHKGVLITDVIQSVIIGILLIVITYGIVGAKNLGALFSVQTGGVDIGTAIGFLLYGIFSTYSLSDRYQLAFAAKTENKLKHGLGLAVIPILFAATLLLLIGLFMAMNQPGLDSGLVFTEALKNFLPLALLPWAIMLFFAGIMSSADTNIYAIASHYAASVKGNFVKTIRKATVGLVIITALIALIWADIVDVSIFGGLISLTLSFPMIYLIFNGRNTSRFLGSIVGGLIGLVLGIAFVGLEPVVVLPVLIASGLGLFYKKKTSRFKLR